jgi:hypothetical protein
MKANNSVVKPKSREIVTFRHAHGDDAKVRNCMACNGAFESEG